MKESIFASVALTLLNIVSPIQSQAAVSISPTIMAPPGDGGGGGSAIGVDPCLRYPLRGC